MTATGQNFTVYQGDTKEVTITVRDEDDVILPLTGYTLNWVMYNRTTRDILLTKTLSDGLSVATPSNGEVLLTLEPADTLSIDTGTYFHELEITSSLGNVSTVTTGIVTILLSRA